jgi:hypothetical protein
MLYLDNPRSKAREGSNWLRSNLRLIHLITALGKFFLAISGLAVSGVELLSYCHRFNLTLTWLSHFSLKVNLPEMLWESSRQVCENAWSNGFDRQIHRLGQYR